MKKFTCLLVALLAVGMVYSACPTTAATLNAFQLQCNAYQASCALTTAAGVAQSAGSCGAAATNLCCDDTKAKPAVSTEITKIKGQFTDFGGAVARLGGLFAKILTLTGASTVNTTIDGAAAADLSGATTAQFKTWAMYTGAMFDADFTAYKAQVGTCYDYYAASVQKIACHACLPANADITAWNTDATIPMTQASCNEWVTKCNKVWTFMHKVGWFVQVVAFLNKKKDTASAVTYSPPANTALYAAGLQTVADIDTAITTCGADPTVAACTDTIKGNLCKAFIGVWSGATALSVGRSDKTFIQSSYNPTSTVTRRQLAATIATGAISIAATGVDTTSANTLVMPPTAAIATIDTTAWSSGYVAPAGTTSSSGGTTTTTSSKSSAQVLIGTVLSAIFAVALLN